MLDAKATGRAKASNFKEVIFPSVLTGIHLLSIKYQPNQYVAFVTDAI